MRGGIPISILRGLLNGKNDVRSDGNHAQGSTKLCGLHVGPIPIAALERIEEDTVDNALTPPKDAREFGWCGKGWL